MLVVSREDVRRWLDMPTCIGLMRSAMIAVAQRKARQIPRQAVPLEAGMLGVMAGTNGPTEAFGAKILSVMPGNRAQQRPSHQGGILLFGHATGAPVAVVDAAEITAIRTAAASAAATDALARKDARILAILGYGEQAAAHVHAIRVVRPIDRVHVWGRDASKRHAFAAEMAAAGIACEAYPRVAQAVADADIVCTTTAASDPILFSDAVRCGTHINLVGSSFAGSAEADVALVAKSRYFADHRVNVLAQGGEFVRARDAGRIDDTHCIAEIGEVFDGSYAAARDPADITIYKSLGHIAQDLASAWHVYAQVRDAAGSTMLDKV